MANQEMINDLRDHILQCKLTPKEEPMLLIPTPSIEPNINLNNTIPTFLFPISIKKHNFFQPSNANIKRFLWQISLSYDPKQVIRDHQALSPLLVPPLLSLDAASFAILVRDHSSNSIIIDVSTTQSPFIPIAIEEDQNVEA